ncbi:SID1 transmembrane family member 1-like isoform X1 [Argiope bruennichi]|uniref:SID1 transmembrane family member 1-like isoform X1 n=1 Tax=Argiope bruennichi TaxID=94029 RepID=UPI002494B51B|nr:SID1 transmembrane family member 1-like isoform X1 [Argiope bruennichi]
MALLVNLRQLLNFLAVIFLIFSDLAVSKAVIEAPNRLDPACACEPQPKKLNESVSGRVASSCPQCFVFTYDFNFTQDWAARLCVMSVQASVHAPMFVVVRESLNVMSFQLPILFPGVSPYYDTCRTLCPLANYNETTISPGPQNISIEISTSSNIFLDFDFLLSQETGFILTKDSEVNVTITPSKPWVMQYSMEESLRAVRIEATSDDPGCMVLAIQDIVCPIHDSLELVEPQGYYQTLLHRSGISISKKTFNKGQQYVILMLKPTDTSCLEESNSGYGNREKQVTLQVVPAITDAEYYEAVFGAFGFYVLIYIFSFIICIFLFVRRRRNTGESQNVSSSGGISTITDVENPSVHNYGTSSESESASEQSPTRSLRDFTNPPPLNPSPVSFDETDIDKLPDAEVDKNIVRTKTVLFVSDLARKKEKYLSDRTKVYSWNLLTIAIFYGLPVVQLVYINQRIVNMTGNQDLCYYNFLCSHQVGVFSDFNHVYSNIGYVMLGILFLLLVGRRDAMDSYYEAERRKLPPTEMTGIPRHYGLMYAMGWALIMEGVLSASYHVCPNRANFQFDTAFMYVIATVCMLKLYQSRHPDIAVKSHVTWMVLSVVIIIGFGGVVKGGLLVWIPFFLAHSAVTFVVSAKIYYMGRCKIDRWIWKRMYHSIKIDIAARSFQPVYRGRFIMLSIAVLLNFSLDLFGLISQPPNFGAFLLSVFIANLMMYLIYYSMMKIRYKEGIRWIPAMYMVLSFICWGAALVFFLAKNTSWQVTPAESRERNKHCIILNFFDHHDVWHFLSSCALFFSFMVLFTLDDDLENTPRSKIIVF